MSQKSPVRIQFAPLDPEKDDRGKARKQSPLVEISNGEYHRTFELKDQPFECPGLARTEGEPGQAREVVIVTAEEEAAMLLRTGHFVEVPSVADKKAAPAVTGQIGGAPPPPIVPAGTRPE